MTASTRIFGLWAAADAAGAPVAVEGDRALLVLAAGGDEKACRELIERHGGRLLQIVRAAHPDLHVAEDVVQETFIRALGRADDLRAEASMFPWLVRIALRAALDYRRKVRRETSVPEAPERGFSPEGELEAREDSRRVRDALAQLKPYPRELMVLRYFASFSVCELAVVFNKSEVAVRKDLQRARERMRVLLGASFEEGRER